MQENIMFLEKEKWLSKQKDVGSTLNNYFGLTTDSLTLL